MSQINSSQTQTNNNVKCSKDVISQSACLNKNCSKYAFTCPNKLCDCRNQHKSCFMIETKTIIDNFSSKIAPSQLTKTINQQFKKLYEQISKIKNKLLKDISIMYDLYGLNEDQKLVYSSLKSGNTSSITGSHIWKACMTQGEEKTQNVDELISSLTGSLTRYEKAAGIFFAKISKSIKEYNTVKEIKKNEVKKQVKTKQQDYRVIKDRTVKVVKAEDEDESDRRVIQKNRDRNDYSRNENNYNTNNNINNNSRNDNNRYNNNGNYNLRDNERQTRDIYRKQDRRQDRRHDNRQDNNRNGNNRRRGYQDDKY